MVRPCRRRPPATFSVLAALLVTGGCGAGATSGAGGIVQPGAPGQPGRVLTADEVDALPRPGITEADVRFMQRMIGHHAQALEMVELLETRTANPDMKKLAQRIQVSQADEIAMMQQWLRDRGYPLADAHAHHAPGAAAMPGMLSEAEMVRLAAAKGPEFDRLFLEYMIKHHDGALVMVRELYAQPGAAQESEINAFASEVAADQRMEIDRMAAMLATLKE